MRKLNKMIFADIYQLYINKVTRKDRTKEELDEVIFWLTGYNAVSLQDQIDKNANFEEFFNEAPQINENAYLIKGIICGIRVEEIEDELTWKVRCLDKLVDELAKGKTMDKILRK